MSEAKYNAVANFYVEFVRAALSSPTSVLSVVTEQVVKTLGDVKGLQICDLACGEGHLARRLAERGGNVTGVDVSEGILEQAKQQMPTSLDLHYVQDDAQTLATFLEQSFDIVVSNLALMDIPDFESVFDSCFRVLKPGGTFVFSVLHPCFETPFDADHPPIETSRSGGFLACRVSRYLEEGYWTSGGEGVRGRVGAYHRTLSSYLNALLASGFQLSAVHEPTLPAGDYGSTEEQWLSRLPRGLVLKSRKP